MSNKLEGFDVMAAVTAQDVDQAFWINFWISIVLFLSVVAPMIYFAWKYRADKVKNEDIENVTHNTTLEIAWTLIPTALLMVLFFYGYTSMRALRTMPAENKSLVINVEGRKWSWKHTYPANKQGYVHKTAELYVPKDTNVILKMTAPLNDVIHSYYIPALRMKEDVVPGRITKQWFNVSKPGVFDVECAEYCGTRHSYMLTKIHVMEPEAYKKWFESKSRRPGEPEKQMSRGEQLFAENGCSGCHALESDKVIVGPSLKGIALKHDFQYLKDAIIHPNKDVPEGFTAGVMPAFKMSDEDVKALIDYISGAEKGKVVFEENGCAGCHATDSDKVLVGPSLKDIGKKHDVAYLKDAITNPDKDVAKGFSPGVMPPFKLPEDQLNNLIAYLKTL